MYDLFQMDAFEFPETFLWGSSTAAHQIEGDNIHSNFWKMEENNCIWAPGDVEEPSGKACNHWELYRDDVELLSQLGHQTYRMSIAWSRIEPTEGEWDEEAVAHYVDLLERLCDKGIKPMVTLHHFTHPQWFKEKGGFTQEENLPFFYRFAEKIVPQIKAYVHSWNIFNEFNMGDYYGTTRKINCLRAQAHLYHYLKSQSDATVSSAHALQRFHPRRQYDAIDSQACSHLDFVINEFFFHALRTGEIVYTDSDAVYLPELKGAIDYWAVNFYTRTIVDGRTKSLTTSTFPYRRMKLIDKPFFYEEMTPEAFADTLQRFKDLPVIITENGCSANDDRFRIVHLVTYLRAIREAMDMGVDVQGYTYWSTMDNYEWGSYKPKFGLVEVDRETFERRPKPSAWFYKKIIETGRVDQELIRDYLTHMPSNVMK